MILVQQSTVLDSGVSDKDKEKLFALLSWVPHHRIGMIVDYKPAL